MDNLSHLPEELKEKIKRNNRRHAMQSEIFDLFQEAGRGDEEIMKTIKDIKEVLQSYESLLWWPTELRMIIGKKPENMGLHQRVERPYIALQQDESC